MSIKDINRELLFSKELIDKEEQKINFIELKN